MNIGEQRILSLVWVEKTPCITNSISFFKKDLSNIDHLERVGGNWSTWRKPSQTQREHANSTQVVLPEPGQTQDSLDVRWADLNSNPRPSCCKATVQTTKPPASDKLKCTITFNNITDFFGDNTSLQFHKNIYVWKDRVILDILMLERYIGFT